MINDRRTTWLASGGETEPNVAIDAWDRWVSVLKRTSPGDDAEQNWQSSVWMTQCHDLTVKDSERDGRFDRFLTHPVERGFAVFLHGLMRSQNVSPARIGELSDLFPLRILCAVHEELMREWAPLARAPRCESAGEPYIGAGLASTFPLAFLQFQPSLPSSGRDMESPRRTVGQPLGSHYIYSGILAWELFFPTAVVQQQKMDRYRTAMQSQELEMRQMRALAAWESPGEAS
jgi:hypothetical protein